MVIFMKNTLKYIVSISALHALFCIVYMSFIEIEVFYTQFFYNILRIILFVICGYLLANFLSTITQFIYGKLKGYECCVLNMYPIYVVRGRLKFSMNLINMVDIRTMYAIHQLDHRNQQDLSSIKEQTKKFQLVVFFVLGIVWFIVAMYFKIYMLIFISCTCFGWGVSCMYFKEIDFIHETDFPLKEMMYSKEINRLIVLDYIGQYVENVVMYEYEPQYLYSIILFVILFYRHQLHEQDLVQLDNKVYTLFQKHNMLNVACRAIIFDYYDIRYCLSKDYHVRDYAYRALSEFIEYDWDIKLVPKFISRYSEIKEAYSNKQSLQVEKKYNRYFW